MKKHNGVCSGCSTGCSISIEENQDAVFRLKPRDNPEINKWWMCDEGRYNYGVIHKPERLNGPKRRKGGGYNANQFVNIEWSAVPQMVAADIKAELENNKGHMAMVVSPFQTVEEAYLLCKLARSFDPQATLVLGPVPTVSQDESYPGGFTIHAEKMSEPTRRGKSSFAYARKPDQVRRFPY